LLLAAALAGRAGEAPPDPDVTTLDPVFVEASTGTPWRYFATPDFEVLSHCTDPFNAAFAQALREATAARLALLPARYWGDVPTRMRLVLYNREPAQTGDFRRHSPIDLAWTNELGASAEAVVLTHPLVVGEGDGFLSCGNYWGLVDDLRDLTVDPDSEARLVQRAPRRPAWFVSGLEGPMGLYVGHRIRPTPQGPELALLPARWSSDALTQALRAAAAPNRRKPAAPIVPVLLPLQDLFAGTVPTGQENLWNAEAALLVRWGLYGAPDRAAFLRVVDAAAAAPLTEAVVERELGLTFADLRARLAAYVAVAVTQAVTVPLAGTAAPAPPLRDATPVEVARILGDWGRLEARSLGLQESDYLNECLEQADRQFERGHLSRTHDPDFLASYGLYQLQRGDRTAARAALEEAVAAGVVRPKAYVELARLRLDALVPAAGRGRGDLSYDDFSGILDLLGTAQRQMPSLEETYRVMARAWDHGPGRPTRAELAVFRQALQLFPADVPLAHRIAKLYAANGYREDAAAIVDDALRFAGTAAERSFLTSVTAR
jgi:tetratricopeptide (TPR) repeat protein